VPTVGLTCSSKLNVFPVGLQRKRQVDDDTGTGQLEKRNPEPRTHLLSRTFSIAGLLPEARKNVAETPSAWPIQSMSVEIRSGQGRLRSGSETAVASRDGLAA